MDQPEALTADVALGEIGGKAAPRTKEVEHGNVEYKLHLLDPAPDRFMGLVTQMVWRMREGSGRAVYCIGVTDDGVPVGLPDSHMRSSLRTIRALAAAAGAFIDGLKLERGHDDTTIVAEVRIARAFFGQADASDASACAMRSVDRTDEGASLLRSPSGNTKPEVCIAVAGHERCGKSSLIACLTCGCRDDGHGSARYRVFRHPHEVLDGRTSSIGRHLIGFDASGALVCNAADRSLGVSLAVGQAQTGTALSAAAASEAAPGLAAGASEAAPGECYNGVDVLGSGLSTSDIAGASARLVTLLDLAGSTKYMRTTLGGLLGCQPDYMQIMLTPRSVAPPHRGPKRRRVAEGTHAVDATAGAAGGGGAILSSSSVRRSRGRSWAGPMSAYDISNDMYFKDGATPPAGVIGGSAALAPMPPGTPIHAPLQMQSRFSPAALDISPLRPAVAREGALLAAAAEAPLELDEETQGHIMLAVSTGTPFFVVVSQVDACSAAEVAQCVAVLQRFLASHARAAAQQTTPLLLVDSVAAAISAAHSLHAHGSSSSSSSSGSGPGATDTVAAGGAGPVPLFLISSVSSAGFPSLLAFLSALPPRHDWRSRVREPAEVHILEVVKAGDGGAHTVVAGLVTSGCVRLGDALLLGPGLMGHFMPVAVASIHVLRVPVATVAAGQTATMQLTQRLLGGAARGGSGGGFAGGPVAKGFTRRGQVLLAVSALSSGWPREGEGAPNAPVAGGAPSSSSAAAAEGGSTLALPGRGTRVFAATGVVASVVCCRPSKCLLRPGHHVTVFCANVRQEARVVAVRRTGPSAGGGASPSDHAAGHAAATVSLRFLHHCEYIVSGSSVVIRDGRTTAAGAIVGMYPDPDPRPVLLEGDEAAGGGAGGTAVPAPAAAAASLSLDPPAAACRDTACRDALRLGGYSPGAAPATAVGRAAPQKKKAGATSAPPKLAGRSAAARRAAPRVRERSAAGQAPDDSDDDSDGGIFSALATVGSLRV